ncbi:hypothetical protein BJ508DRAFT_332469 [Ascobolus immersus RN42]|uniref:Uncharacterized protein n=1 Tax=Ascobolus immersus RN42 TaxID=1160509 RepID=A0A3N4HP85_ASCIM|nr:hypothetical protein BJ508DRAFT_332469 [Ascobolus immersus RN42]
MRIAAPPSGTTFPNLQQLLPNDAPPSYGRLAQFPFGHLRTCYRYIVHGSRFYNFRILSSPNDFYAFRDSLPQVGISVLNGDGIRKRKRIYPGIFGIVVDGMLLFAVLDSDKEKGLSTKVDVCDGCGMAKPDR